MIAETCSCGAKFKTDEADPIKLVKDWRKNHHCQEPATELRDFETSSTIGFSADYRGTGLDVPAKEYDPWDE